MCHLQLKQLLLSVIPFCRKWWLLLANNKLECWIQYFSTQCGPAYQGPLVVEMASWQKDRAPLKQWQVGEWLLIIQLWFIRQKLFCCTVKSFVEWKGINRKQSTTRWQHLSQLKASAFFSLQKIFSYYETQQLILGTGTAIWWLTEPHCTKNVLLHWSQWIKATKQIFLFCKNFNKKVFFFSILNDKWSLWNEG